MTAGELRHRVQFSEPDKVSDEYGNVTTGWIARFTVSANIRPRLGGETVEAARLQGRQPMIIRVRQSPDTIRITTDWKATDERGVDYQIRTAVDPDFGSNEHGKWIDMMCEAGVAT